MSLKGHKCLIMNLYLLVIYLGLGSFSQILIYKDGNFFLIKLFKRFFSVVCKIPLEFIKFKDKALMLFNHFFQDDWMISSKTCFEF